MTSKSVFQNASTSRGGGGGPVLSTATLLITHRSLSCASITTQLYDDYYLTQKLGAYSKGWLTAGNSNGRAPTRHAQSLCTRDYSKN